MKKSDLNRVHRIVQYQKDKRKGELLGRRKKDDLDLSKKDKRMTTLVVPNRTTYMKVGKELDKEKVKNPKHPKIPKSATFLSSFTPVQLKIMIFLVKEIQKFIQPQLSDVNNYAKNKTEKNRLSLIDNHESLIEEFKGSYFCEIPKKMFVSGRNYARFEQEVHSLAWIPVQFKTRHPKNNRMVLKSTTLFSVYEYLEPNKEKQRSISIEIQKDVLILLSRISVAPKGEALWDCDYYSKIGYDVILNSKRKYTGLLYFYLCPWRNKGGWRIKTQELKSLLGIPKMKYSRINDFKKRILAPASNELRTIGDLWFEFSFSEDYTVFKIITKKRLEKDTEAISAFISLLKSCHIEDKERIQSLNYIAKHPKFHNKAKGVISNCMNEYYKKERSGNKINYLPDYIYTSLRRLNDGMKK